MQTLPFPAELDGHCGPLCLTGDQDSPTTLVWVNYRELHEQFTATAQLRCLRGQTGPAPLNLNLQPAPQPDDPAWLHEHWRSPRAASGLTFTWTPTTLDAPPLSVTSQEVTCTLLLGWIRADTPDWPQAWNGQLLQLLRASGLTSGSLALRALAMPALWELLIHMPGSPELSDLCGPAPQFSPGARTLGFHALRGLIARRHHSSPPRRTAEHYESVLARQITLSGLRNSGAGPLCAAWLMATGQQMEVRADFPELNDWITQAATGTAGPVSEELALHLNFQLRNQRWWPVMRALITGRGVPAEDQQWLRTSTDREMDCLQLLPDTSALPPTSACALSEALKLDDDLPVPGQPDHLRALNWRQRHAARLTVSGAQAQLWSQPC